MSDEAIEAIADALIYAYSDAVLCGSCRWVDELKDRAEYVLDALRAAGFELYRPDDLEGEDALDSEACGEILHIKGQDGREWVTTCLEPAGEHPHEHPHVGLVTWMKGRQQGAMTKATTKESE